MLDKTGIAKRIAREIKNGSYVNLGIGIPTLVANYIPKGFDAQKLALELGILTYIRRDHFFYLPPVQHQADTKIVYARIV